ncbi:MAG: methyltransferase domain-containing protein, partial [Actinobacteria bacterium]|nr:methyltransferase domain-containing protein [Actinomycetota bacterium]
MQLRELVELAVLTFRSDVADLALRLVGRHVRHETAAAVPGFPELILDICTGTGSILIEYARRFPTSRVITVDRDPRALALVARRLRESGSVNLETVTGEADDLPFTDGTVDIVNISFGLHENDRRSRERILKECFRVLNPGGRLVVTDYREARGSVGPALMRLYLALFEPRWVPEIF